MKTIAVLTDLSERSIQAARYALYLAQRVKADILLFNAFLVPSDIAMAAGQISWPVNEYESTKADAERSLKELCEKLEKELRSKNAPGTPLPAITWQCEEAPVAATLSLLEQNKELILLVAATHGADRIQTFVLGNNCRELIDAAGLPLLLVPDNAPVADLEKLVFATDLDSGDIVYINALTRLAEAFSAYITIVNVDPEVPSDSEHNQRVNAFMQEMVLKVDYRHINYRNIPNRHVKKGLNAVLEIEQPGMLVMVHRRTSFPDFFLRSSHTKKMAAHAAFPLLVYPFPADRVPLF
ncbi:Nucleotide-binding universal stress protein, UspA family [Mucilaginibacter pineti]|uniref:Nucleotide-binding universal stress protein, UspA family n=1 Tax=Mucilaginibacter pineti TaxID=1391627 RepID=A0A1G7JME8_9SPHI|nr:universal stress protein [Mucilaginibacter pineti]SDF26140.1 Nucleotide-binding universal stress protein, UspA family [Mucilaginibacter pineti]